MLYYIYFKTLEKKGGKVDKIRAGVLGYKIGCVLGSNHLSKDNYEKLPNGYHCLRAINEKAAKKIYKILLSNYLIADIDVRPITDLTQFNKYFKGS